MSNASERVEKYTPVHGRGFSRHGGGFAEIIVGDRTYPAAHIVLCVGAHEALVEMARLLEKTIKYEIKRDEDDEGRSLKRINLHQVRAALKLAGVEG